MYERMLDKQVTPTIQEMAAYCKDSKELFLQLNEWLSCVCGTAQKVVFPYGNQYGWGVSHRKKQKLICNVFAEDDAFTVMLRLSNRQYESVYNQVQAYTKGCIDNKFPCGDGGWIHYRITCREHFEDIRKLLTAKCS